MKLKLPFLLACFLAGVSLIASGDDKLIAVDPASGLVTLDQRGALKSYRAKAFTQVTINGAKATLQELRPGMMVAVTLADSQLLSLIAARGNTAPPAAPPKVEAAEPTGTNRRISLKLRVDGSDVIKVNAGRLWIEHAGAKKPIEISVNGTKWEPAWTREKSEAFSAFSPALAPFTRTTLAVKQTNGRGKTTIVDLPTTENQQTLAFRIQDGGNGADDYEVRVTW